MRGLAGALLLFAGCSGMGFGTGSSATHPAWPLAAVMLSGTTWTPAVDRLTWVGGRGSGDVWVGSDADGALRTDGVKAPTPVPGLSPGALGGTFGDAAFLDDGTVLGTVRGPAGSLRLIRWSDGAVKDHSGDLGLVPSVLGAQVERMSRPPGEPPVVVLHAPADPQQVSLWAWTGAHFERGLSFPMPLPASSAHVFAGSANEAWVVGADASGAYAIDRVDAGGSSLAYDAKGAQFSGALLLTAASTGFIAVGGMGWFDGQALRPAAMSDATSSFPFAPDGLASLEAVVGEQPTAFVQHATAKGRRVALSTGPTRVRAAGLAGNVFVAVVDPVAPAEASMAVVPLTAGP